MRNVAVPQARSTGAPLGRVPAIGAARAAKIFRHQGCLTTTAVARLAPHRWQKCRSGLLPAPQLPQIRSPGLYLGLAGASRRGAGRARSAAGATACGSTAAGIWDGGVSTVDEAGGFGVVGAA